MHSLINVFSGLYWGMDATLYATERADCIERCRQAWSSFCFKCNKTATGGIWELNVLAS